MNAINPSHYKNNGPFECIELSRLYMSDWGQVIQYVWRHKAKNGVEDLYKALWFARDAERHRILPDPIETGSNSTQAIDMLRKLMSCNHAGAWKVWTAFYHFSTTEIINAIEELIKEEETR